MLQKDQRPFIGNDALPSIISRDYPHRSFDENVVLRRCINVSVGQLEVTAGELEEKVGGSNVCKNG